MLHEKEFYGIIFEHVEMDGSLKYLVTFSKSGKLKSKIIIALFCRSGTYTNEDGGRSPFWASSEGCIDSNLNVNVDAGGMGNDKYKINSDGTIMDIK